LRLQNRPVMALLGIVCSLTSALGQTLRLTPAVGKAGESVTIEVALQSSSPSSEMQPAALQWETRIPSDKLQLQGGSPHEAVQPAKDLGKFVTCALISKTAEDQILRCVVAGGDKAIPSGAVARLTFRISEEASIGDAPIRLEHVLAVTRDLKQLPLENAVAMVTIRGRSDAKESSHNGTVSSPLRVTASSTVSSSLTLEVIGYWNFDEGTGSIAHDISGHGYNGTINNAAWTNGKINSALTFDGASSVVTPNIALGNTFSVSAWVKPVVVPQRGYARIAETHYNAGLYLGTNANGSKYQFIVDAGSGSTSSCGVTYGCAVGGTVARKWQLVTGTYDGTTAKLYVDAVLVARDTFTAPANTNLPLHVGQYNGGGYGWNGVVDEVRLYNRALTATEVNSIYSGTP